MQPSLSRHRRRSLPSPDPNRSNQRTDFGSEVGANKLSNDGNEWSVVSDFSANDTCWGSIGKVNSPRLTALRQKDSTKAGPANESVIDGRREAAGMAPGYANHSDGIIAQVLHDIVSNERSSEAVPDPSSKKIAKKRRKDDDGDGLSSSIHHTKSSKEYLRKAQQSLRDSATSSSSAHDSLEASAGTLSTQESTQFSASSSSSFFHDSSTTITSRIGNSTANTAAPHRTGTGNIYGYEDPDNVARSRPPAQGRRWGGAARRRGSVTKFSLQAAATAAAQVANERIKRLAEQARANFRDVGQRHDDKTEEMTTHNASPGSTTSASGGSMLRVSPRTRRLRALRPMMLAGEPSHQRSTKGIVAAPGNPYGCGSESAPDPPPRLLHRPVRRRSITKYSLETPVAATSPTNDFGSSFNGDAARPVDDGTTTRSTFGVQHGAENQLGASTQRSNNLSNQTFVGGINGSASYTQSEERDHRPLVLRSSKTNGIATVKRQAASVDMPPFLDPSSNIGKTKSNHGSDTKNTQDDDYNDDDDDSSCTSSSSLASFAESIASTEGDKAIFVSAPVVQVVSVPRQPDRLPSLSSRRSNSFISSGGTDAASLAPDLQSRCSISKGAVASSSTTGHDDANDPPVPLYLPRTPTTPNDQLRKTRKTVTKMSSSGSSSFRTS